MTTPSFTLNATLDPAALARSYAEHGRVHIPALLDVASARALYNHLRRRDDWRLIVNQGDSVFELDRAAQAALTDRARHDLETAVSANARGGFQYRYEAIRVPDSVAERVRDDSLLVGFARFMSSEPILDLLRSVTGSTGIDFSDAQATAYGPGHSLTAHDDEIAGKNRHAAYVFNLSGTWRPEYGGLLMFHRADGHIDEAYAPSFNALNLFAVPQLHSVSYVVPYVPYRRYAVTGWLRGH